MSLGFPEHLAQVANSTALAIAARSAGLVYLIGSIFSLLLAAPFAEPSVFNAEAKPLTIALMWGAVISLVALGALFVALSRSRTSGLAALTLIVGSGVTFIYTFVLLTLSPSYRNTDLFVLALPVIALTLVGGSGRSTLSGMLWASFGFVLGELAVFVAAVRIDREYILNDISLGFFILVIAILVLDGTTRNSQRGAQAIILRTMRDEQTAVLRHKVAGDVIGELHDTMLSQLSVVAGGDPGRLAPQLRSRIEADLEAWGRDRAVEIASSAVLAQKVSTHWKESELVAAIDQGLDDGLYVEVSGDRSALMKVTPERHRALALAVRQCLVNVLRHSGQLKAEVLLAGNEHEVNVMVVDAGYGFSEEEIPRERLGIRHSVRDRIERVGGTVDIFSSPGAGTAISMTVPWDEVAQDHPDETRHSFDGNGEEPQP